MTCLVEEEKAASHVTLEEELQVVQHGGVSEHEVHQLVAHQAAQLTEQTKQCMPTRKN